MAAALSATLAFCLLAIATVLSLQGCGSSGTIPSPTPSPTPNPTPSPTPPVPERLIVINQCARQPIWIASFSGIGDWHGPAVVKIAPGQKHSYTIPDGLTAMRFWPKMFCDESGQKCKIGDSGGPGQICDDTGCAPPVDSKFEATFGTSGGDCLHNGTLCDWIDTSAVDGYTLPYKIELSDRCKTDSNLKKKGTDIDCSDLFLDACPLQEDLGNTCRNQGLAVRSKGGAGKEIVGCYSPCAKLTSSQWNNPCGTHPPNDTAAGPFCCPTPPVDPDVCRKGPASKSNYHNVIHAKCPHVYSFSYDDGVGLQVCPPETVYTWTLFCPSAEQAGRVGVVI